MRLVTLFILLLYWSAIILAPVIAKERQLSEKQSIIWIVDEGTGEAFQKNINKENCEINEEKL